MVGLLLSGSANIITNFVYAQQQQEEQEQQQYSFVGKWGSFGTGDGQFENVVGIAINSFNNNNVYTSNSNGNPNPGSNHRIQEFTKQGQFITKWGTAGSGNGQFIDPFGIAFDSSGNVYVADQVNQRIQKFTSDGTFIKSWGISTNPTSIAIDSKDNVYITVQFSHLIAKYTSDGTFIKSWGSQGTDNGQFEYPRGIAIDSNDNVYVSDLIPNTLNYRVQKFTSNGTFITSWGSLGGSQATSNQFNGYGIAIDTSNNVYVADSFGNRIQKFTNNGMLITQFGTAGIDNGQFDTPHDIAVDSSGNVYVADTYNHRIQVFALAGTTTTTPDTAITSAIDGNGVAIQNGGSTVSTSITFQVTATTPGTNPIAGFECSLDNSPFSACSITTTNPAIVTLNKLAAGQQHIFEVRAVDTAGNKDSTPASFSWTILTPAQGIQQLLAFSQTMNLNPSIQAMITGVLNSAVSILSDNTPSNDRAACNEFRVLIYQLNIRSHYNQLTTAQATQLIQSSPYSLLAIERAQGCIQ